MAENSIKCVAIGDGYVGKTSLLYRLCDKDFDLKRYSPTIFDNHSITAEYNGKTSQIIFIDTAGQEEYSLLRKQVYDSANVFLVCFAVSSTDSFSNVKQLWLPEIEDYPNARKILVGTKSDLRGDPETIDILNASGSIFVSDVVATNLATSYNMKYVECSALTQANIQKIVETILEVNCAQIEDKITNMRCSCVNPIMRLVKRAICCKNNY